MKSIALFCFLLLGTFCSQAQTNNFSLGFQISELAGDFRLGINVTSPFFAGNAVALRFRGNGYLYEYEESFGIHSVTCYSHFNLGFVLVPYSVENKLRLYYELGLTRTSGLLIQEETQKSFVGLYGLVGFEFLFRNEGAFFIEMGGHGNGAIAEEIEGEPFYSSGFYINVGSRIYF